MLKNYIKIAWRGLVKNKLYSVINIAGLAIGMAVAILIGLWLNDELTYNHFFKERTKIAQVYQSQTFNGEIGTGPAIPRPLEMSIRNEYADNFDHIIMSSWTQSRTLKYGDISISKQGNFMQEEAPDFLNLEIEKGIKNGLKEINSVMLAASTAKALFGDADPIGKVVKMNNEYDLKVTSVYHDIPENNSFNNTKFLIPWEQYVKTNDWINRSIDHWGNNSFQLFVQIANNTSMDKVTAAIKDIKLKADEDLVEYNPQLFLLPMEDWYLRSNFENGVQDGGRIEYVWLFAIIGVFVLLLACINFMNLSTARSEKRAREVGIRKSIGSVRLQLINQFMSESFLVVGFAFVIALFLVLISLPSFNELSSKVIEFPWKSIEFWIASLIFIAFTAIISGSYPALYLSSFEPVKVLKGTFKAGRFSALPRKVLVVLQFTVSVALTISTLMVFQQIQFSKNRPVGYNKEGLIQIPTMSRDFENKYDLMRSEFLNSGAAIEMSSSSSPTTNVYSNRSGFTWEGKPEGFQEDFAWTEVSFDFVKSLGLKIVEGRDFSREFASDTNGVLLNKAAVKYMGIENPIGLLLKDADPESTDPPLKVIGVIEDMIMQSPYEPVKQSVYVFDKYNNLSYYNLRLNPEKSASECITTIEKVYLKHFPDIPFQYQFIDQEYALKFASEERIGKLAGVFTILAIFISCLGLFGLASFVAEQRTKEIGVRKVLGASVGNLLVMLSKDFIKLVFYSLLFSIPASWFFIQNWLEKYTYNVGVTWWVFALSGLGALLITLITISFQAIKAALLNPVKSLRSE